MATVFYGTLIIFGAAKLCGKAKAYTEPDLGTLRECEQIHFPIASGERLTPQVVGRLPSLSKLHNMCIDLISVQLARRSHHPFTLSYYV